jgi:divinyl protochlorophyllide a 8-vinyl-reductase
MGKIDGALAVPPAASHQRGACKVGPNAILQTAEAVLQDHGAAMRSAVLHAAGLPPHGADIDALVDAALVRRLNLAVREKLPRTEALEVMRKAGRLTGEYILANRIPPQAMRLLKLLPTVLSVNLLLKAIARHSWTFAGNAPVRVRHGWRWAIIEIEGNPIAYGPCVWHEAVFARLFSPLAGNRLRVEETACCRNGAAACRFEIHF